MEIQYFGGNCIKLTTKKATLTIDDNLSVLGQKSVTKAGDIALFTSLNHAHPPEGLKIAIDSPGEYEVSDISIQAIPTRAYNDRDVKERNVTIFKIIADDIRIAVLGHAYPELSDEQLEALGAIDVLFIPMGDNGYTLSPTEALKFIKKIEPKIVIPTHWTDKGLKYEVPQLELDTILKEIAMEPKETATKLKLKSTDFGETTQLVILKRQ